MSFVEETPKRTEFKKTLFMNLIEGANVIRIAEKSAVKKWTHYLGISYVECLGQEDCPICKNNKLLQMEYPDDYQKQSAYVPSRRRFYVNVIERTEGKICPDCKTEFKGNIPVHCSKCQKLLGDIPLAPLNQVRVLAGGPVLFEDGLNVIDKAIVDGDNTPIGLMNYDIILMVKGSGKERTITPLTKPPSSLGFDVSSMELFDLTKALVRLTPEEMLEAQRGVSIKDIFVARKANKNADVVTEEPKSIVSESVMDGIQQSMDDLFKTAS